jgi:hypothetical protein
MVYKNYLLTQKTQQFPRSHSDTNKMVFINIVLAEIFS